MKPVIIGDKDAHICLVQAVDEHDEDLLEKEYELIKGQNPEERILLAAVRVDSWNHDLSPWPAAPVFGKEGFGDGAPETLRYILQTLLPMVQKDWLSASGNAKQREICDWRLFSGRTVRPLGLLSDQRLQRLHGCLAIRMVPWVDRLSGRTSAAERYRLSEPWRQRRTGP